MGRDCVEAVGVSNERAQQYQGGVTLYVVVACMVAAIGGSIFGYDIGISGMYVYCPILSNIFHLLSILCAEYCSCDLIMMARG